MGLTDGKPTLAQFERALRAAFLRKGTTLSYTDLPQQYGDIDWRGGKTVIRLDVERCVLPTLVHELLHDARKRELAAWGQLEECVIVGPESAITEYIAGNPRRMRWWRETIRAKVDDSEGT